MADLIAQHNAKYRHPRRTRPMTPPPLLPRWETAGGGPNFERFFSAWVQPAPGAILPAVKGFQQAMKPLPARGILDALEPSLRALLVRAARMSGPGQRRLAQHIRRGVFDLGN